jgi:hypothetical protein
MAGFPLAASSAASSAAFNLPPAFSNSFIYESIEADNSSA